LKLPLLDKIPGFTPSAAGLLGFDISVEDSDSDHRKTELVWSGSADNYRDRSRFGVIRFK
jgi:hypothetical protein